MINLKHVFASVFLIFFVVVNTNAQDLKSDAFHNHDKIKQAIALNLDAWHKAAADANFNSYFNLMTTDAVFVGTDASEHWELEAFKAYSKPHFDKGSAWTFTALERHIFLGDAHIAWFDELLNTQMGVCRGSGVMKFDGQSWKVAHYVLSATIPNDKMNAVIPLKRTEDSIIIKSFTD
ncbi:nuclear transport factor 2 family protein [Formosa sp. 4Alg 33]|uniref:nuclear transport factor 2 family protein n=1 Tax=Formosa sp. 4Alg 33 TaxID=3382189 RepID=UPI003D9C64A7